ncbi:hypothetical protein HK096_011158 [Nowakowskiella sp. JEL0078]|nr:hypothetical protein HK096_011158 [Nowakowskiella sp. JEL0078]
MKESRPRTPSLAQLVLPSKLSSEPSEVTLSPLSDTSFFLKQSKEFSPARIPLAASPIRSTRTSQDSYSSNNKPLSSSPSTTNFESKLLLRGNSLIPSISETFLVRELLTSFDLISARRLLRKFLFGDKWVGKDHSERALSPSSISPEQYLKQAQLLQNTHSIKIYGAFYNPTERISFDEQVFEDNSAWGVIVFRILVDPIFGKHVYVDHIATKNEIPTNTFKSNEENRSAVRKVLLGFAETTASNLGVPLVRQASPQDTTTKRSRSFSLASNENQNFLTSNQLSNRGDKKQQSTNKSWKYGENILAPSGGYAGLDYSDEEDIPGAFEEPSLDRSPLTSPIQDKLIQEKSNKQVRGRSGSLHHSAIQSWNRDIKEENKPLTRNRASSHAALPTSVSVLKDDGIVILDLSPKKKTGYRKPRPDHTTGT